MRRPRLSQRDRRAPWWAAGALALAAAGGKLAGVAGWWPLVAVLAVEALSFAVGERVIRSRWERRYARVVVALGGLWLANALAAPDLWAGVLILAVLTPLVAWPWWRHRRPRPKVDASALGRSERARAERAGTALVSEWAERVASAGAWAGSEILSALASEGAWTLSVKLAPGATLAQARAAADALESALDALAGSVEVRVDPAGRARVAEVAWRLVPLDTRPRAWAGVPERRPSVLDPWRLGQFSASEPIEIILAGMRVLVAGMPGSGKSIVLNLLIAWYAACYDVRLVGADLKGGMEFGVWSKAGVFERLATTPEEAVELLAWAAGESDRRAEQLAALGAQSWQDLAPDARKAFGPAIVVMVDEHGRLGPEAVPHVEKLGEQGRATGVWPVSAVQRAARESFGGSKRTIGIFSVRIGLRVERPGEDRVIFGELATREGWTPSQISPDLPGGLYVHGPGYTQPRLGRSDYMSGDQRDQAARQLGALAAAQPTLDAASLGTGVPADEEADRPAGRAAPTLRLAAAGGELTSDGLVELIAEASRDGGPGITVAALGERTGLSRATVYRRLSALEAAEPPRIRWEKGTGMVRWGSEW